MEAQLNIFKVLAKMNIVPKRTEVAEMIKKLEEVKIHSDSDR